MCKERWLFCFSFILTSDFLLVLMFYWSFNRIFFSKSCHWNCFYIAISRVFRCSQTSCFSISYLIFSDRCDVKTLPCQIWNCVWFMFPSKKTVYRLLHRHQCRRGKRYGLLQCAGMALLSLLRFSFCDVYMTNCNYLALYQIVHRKPRSLFFWNVNRGFSWSSSWTCAHRQLPCRS